MDVVDRLVDELNNLSQKPIMYGVIGMLLGFYGPRLNPSLPNNIKNLLQNNLFRFVVIAVIICVSMKDVQMALIIGIGLMVGISFANSQEVTEKFSSHLGENFINLDNNVAEFYAEDFKNKKEKDSKKEENEGKMDTPKKPVTQQEQDTSVPEANTEKDEGFNNINKYDNLDQFFGYGGSSSSLGSPLEESDPVEMFSNCHKKEESDAVEQFVNYRDEEADELAEEADELAEEADELAEEADELAEEADVEENDDVEEGDDVENFMGNAQSRYEAQLRRTVANYSM